MTPDAEAAPFVVGLDGSQESVHALMWALDEAELIQARVVAVHAWQAEDTVVQGATTEAVIARAESDREALAVIDEQIRDAGAARGRSVVVERRPVMGEPAAALIAASRGARALVVASKRKTRLGRLVLGSVSEACVHGAACPVVVVHRQAHPGAENRRSWEVVVGIDGSPAADRALSFAAAHGRAHRAEVRMVGAVPALASEKDIAEIRILLERAAKPYVDPEVALYFVADAREGAPGEVLCEAARHADLLVVGRRGAGETSSPLGSVSDECVRYSACPVVVVAD
jgi:nucleotide-binding universal stress UspA family protein